MFDPTQLTLPQWFTSAIGIVAIALVWRAVCAAADELIRRSFPKRRIGNRQADDASGGRSMEWYDRLIEAMNANADVNTEVAKSLAILVGKQDVALQAFSLLQVQHRETITKVDTIMESLKLKPQGA